MRYIIYFLFFVSGACGLVYETVWAKHLGLVLGNTAHAHTVVLAVFLGGLALGNAWLGKYADRVRNQVLLYAWLELGIGALGALSPVFIGRLTDVYVGMAQTFGLHGPAAFLVRLSLAAAVLLPPTILMGGTLPALCRFAAAGARGVEVPVSRLYFLNSAGAVLGTLCAAFVLIPAWGLDFSVTFAAGCNILIGAACLALARRRIPAPAKRAAKEEGGSRGRPAGTREIRILYAAVLVAGFVSLSYEIAWIRLLTLVLGSSTYSFSIMLAAFISGIALGSLLVSRRLLPDRDPYLLFGLVELGVVLSLVVTLPLYPHMPYVFFRMREFFQPTPAVFHAYQGAKFLFCFLLMAVPTSLIGMTLPLAARVATRRASEVGEKVGRVFAWNTLGNVLGAAAAGLFLLSWLGVKNLFQAGMLLNWCVGAAVVATAGGLSRRRRAALMIVPLVLAVGYAAATRQWDRRLLTSAVYRGPVRGEMSHKYFMMGVEAQEVLFYREDSAASVAVVRDPGGFLLLKINGKTDASTGADFATQMLFGHIPLFLRPEAKDVMVVGMGSGITAGSALTHPIERLDLVEISPAVVEASRFFERSNNRPLADPRLRLHVDDANTVLRTSKRRYDIIISEPSNPWMAGIGNLFTREFFARAKARLREGGLMGQWIHDYDMTDDLMRLVVRTFCASFENVTLWSPRPGDLMLIGSSAPIEPDFDAMEGLLRRGSIKRDLVRVGLKRLATLLSLQTATDVGARRLSSAGLDTGRVNEDGFPILEYEAPKAFFMNATANVVRERDERVRPLKGSELLFARYLASRGGKLDREEWEELAQLHRAFGALIHKLYLEAWAARFPDDDEAAWLSARVLWEEGRLDAARSKLERLLRRRKVRPEFAMAAADLEFELFMRDHSSLGTAELDRTIAAVRRLESLQAVPRSAVELRWGRIRAAQEDYDQAFRRLEASAGLAAKEGGNPLEALVEAMELALAIGERRLAREYARLVLRHDPSHERAISVDRRLGASTGVRH